MNLDIKSTAFGEGDLIPKQYTCDGADVSPQLSWSQPSEGTGSMVLICNDLMRLWGRGFTGFYAGCHRIL